MAIYTVPLLNDDDLTELTGYSQRGKQVRWLRRNSIGFVLRHDGRPRTTWGAVEAALIGDDRSRVRTEPDFSQMD